MTGALKTWLFKISDDTKTYCLSCTAPDADIALQVLLKTLQYDGELVEVVDAKTVKTRVEENPPQWKIMVEQIAGPNYGDDESARAKATQ